MLGSRLIDLGMGLVDLSLVVAVIEAHQHGASFDQLIVGHRHIDNGGIDLRTDRHCAGVNESIIGALIAAGVDPPGHDCDDRGNEEGGYDQHHAALLAHTIEPRLWLGRLTGGRSCFPTRRDVLTALSVGALIHDRDD